MPHQLLYHIEIIETLRLILAWLEKFPSVPFSGCSIFGIMTVRVGQESPELTGVGYKLMQLMQNSNRIINSLVNQSHANEFSFALCHINNSKDAWILNRIQLCSILGAESVKYREIWVVKI